MAELSVPIDTREITITPLFRYESLEDINASEREGHLVKNMIQAGRGSEDDGYGISYAGKKAE